MFATTTKPHLSTMCLFLAVSLSHSFPLFLSPYVSFSFTLRCVCCSTQQRKLSPVLLFVCVPASSFYDFISMHSNWAQWAKEIWIAPVKIVKFCKSRSNKFDTKHDNLPECESTRAKREARAQARRAISFTCTDSCRDNINQLCGKYLCIFNIETDTNWF